ncbi:alpha/beta hydrolase [Fibrobacter sp.]|uniref:alpha/beta hydrolase n=1 Tax=Fibrobacter sp. TaxID=35828 RepID=UPI0025BBA1E7|nr:alpha/beta hydrolase [Fibrobacter sp.]
MKKIMVAVGVTAVLSFAQFGGGFGGGFGGPQGSGGVPNSDKTADVNYVGDGKPYHTLDIYVPKEAKESYPVVIHTYGSAWSSNNMKGSADLSTICAAYVKAGYAVVTPNHRAANDAKYPAQLHDIKAVVRFVRGNAAKYKFDTNFVAVSGFSSGGHLSSLTATTCGLKEGKSGSVTVDLVGDLGEFTSFSSCVDGAVLWSPPTDIYTMNPISMGGSGTMEGAFIGVEREGNKDKWMVASSPYYASDDDPPVIMFHGTSDNVVNIEQSQELYDSLKHHNVVTEFVKVSGGSHGGDKMNSSENLSKAVAFLDKAREAKAAKAPDTTVADTSKKDTAVVDTSKKDTTVKDTTVKDTTIGLIPKFAKFFDIEIRGNHLFVRGMEGAFRYTIIAVNGSRKFSGVFRKELDLSSLPPGIYGIMAESPSGVTKIIRFVRK